MELVTVFFSLIHLDVAPVTRHIITNLQCIFKYPSLTIPIFISKGTSSSGTPNGSVGEEDGYIVKRKRGSDPRRVREAGVELYVGHF